MEVGSYLDSLLPFHCGVFSPHNVINGMDASSVRRVLDTIDRAVSNAMSLANAPERHFEPCHIRDRAPIVESAWVRRRLDAKSILHSSLRMVHRMRADIASSLANMQRTDHEAAMAAVFGGDDVHHDCPTTPKSETGIEVEDCTFAGLLSTLVLLDDCAYRVQTVLDSLRITHLTDEEYAVALGGTSSLHIAVPSDTHIDSSKTRSPSLRGSSWRPSPPKPSPGGTVAVAQSKKPLLAPRQLLSAGSPAHPESPDAAKRILELSIENKGLKRLVTKFEKAMKGSYNSNGEAHSTIRCARSMPPLPLAHTQQ
jgi:hypothetical protein